MITVYLVRHGQTEENLQRIFQGHMPGVLTEEGKQQAIGLRDKLADLSLDAVVSSDLKRVIDTVNLAFGMDEGELHPDGMLVLHGAMIPWEKTRLLREIDWGSWTGLFISSVDTSRLPADAESKEMLYERAGRFLDYLRTHYDGKSVLVVAHGLVNRSIQAQIEGVEVEHLYDVPHMKNAEVRRFVF